MKLTPAQAATLDLRLGRGRLKCETCGSERVLKPSEALSFLNTGWPKCCGETMALASTPADQH